MRFAIGEFRVLAAVGMVTVTMGLSAASAVASDTFHLENDSRTAVLQGLSLWGKGNTMDQTCRTGPFPGPTETPFTFDPGDKGSITLSEDPFSDCLPGVNPLIANEIQGPGSNGAWVWIPVDPFIGSAHLTCSLLAQTGSHILESSVDGLTCTIADAGEATSGTFGSSVAPLRDGEAVAYIQHFPKSAGRQAPADYRVTLRSDAGRVLGREEVAVAAGKPKRVKVPVSKSVRREVRENDFAAVEAVMKRADGKKGSGDRATLTVMRNSEDVPF